MAGIIGKTTKNRRKKMWETTIFRNKCITFAPIKTENMETQILQVREPYNYIHCNGSTALHVATPSANAGDMV